MILIFSVEDELVDEFTPRRKISFKNIIPLPHRERSSKLRKKTFQMHRLTSTENQMIIQKSEIISQKKEEKKTKKRRKLKEFWQKKNKKRRRATEKRMSHVGKIN